MFGYGKKSWHKRYKNFLRIDEATYGGYDLVDLPHFSADGSIFAIRYINDGKWFVQINDIVYGGFDWAHIVHFSWNGSEFGFVYRQEDKWYVQLNEKTFGPYDNADITITNDNRIFLAYVKDDYVYIERIE